MSRWQDHFPWTAAVARVLWPEGPARRKRWLKLAAAVLLVVAVHALGTAWMAASAERAAAPFVRRWGPLDVRPHVPAPVEDRANQARAVRAATEILALPDHAGERAVRDLASGKGEALSAAERDGLRRTVQDNALAFTLLDVAVGRRQSNWNLHYGWGASMDIPPLRRLLDLGKLNVVAGQLALEEGRVEEAIAAVRRGAALASSLQAEPVLIVQVVRMALARGELGLVRRILATVELRPGQLDELDALLPQESSRQLMQHAYVVETKALHGVVRGEESMAREPGRPGDALGLQLGIVRAVLRPYLLREERLLFEVMTRRIDDLDAARHARKERDEKPRIRRWDVLVPGYDGKAEIDRADVAEARETLARAALALERYRLASGHPPASLADLTPAVPLDPLTGRAFQYDTDGRSWRIHSTFDLRAVGDVATWADPLLDWSSSPRASLLESAPHQRPRE